ncbi:hypothetical protein H4R21_002708 [Coemansia helicoidea]|uniref:Uncharacterized protein n=1 Tax=Coemansia helicoidea TaxID=1286919 RepID=A0ACC1L622_9FUNG|nr:hypothetical protein H4R21_002708 [Coemansia helicoidea]
MSFFDLINPFSYATPLHADGSEPTPDSEDAAIVAPDVVEEPAAAAEEAAEDEVEEATEEEEEEAEAEDHAPIIREGKDKARRHSAGCCAPLRIHADQRVHVCRAS